MQGWKFVLLFIAAMILMLLLLCQDTDNPPAPAPIPAPARNGLLPGEVNDPNWPKPIIVSVKDETCSDTDKCPPVSEDCAHKTFTVQKDTLYYMTLSYFNGDTLNPSCRVCGTVYDDRTIVMNNVTACPTSEPWVSFARLVPGKTYTVEACLQSCPNHPGCKCGESVHADAAISMRRQF
ncbi:MAG: hypothetical protein IPG71_02670 [bacterium]|nr:hypothetical protein [bacterium]